VVDWKPHPYVDPLPGWLTEAVDRVFADLQQPTAVDVRVGYDTEWRLLAVSEGEPPPRPPASVRRGGCLVTDEERGAWLVVGLAQWLQQYFFPESRGAWGEARPTCPGHSRPAVPGVEDDEAWWFCPVDGRRIAAIGQALA
jgi:hypothetical protein